MKKQKIFIIFLLLSGLSYLSSCDEIFRNTITGSGEVVSEIREVGSFDAISASAGMNVIVTFGDPSEEIEVVADDNLHEVITTEVVAGTLKITSRASIRRAESKDVYVSSGRLESIEVSSAANLRGNNAMKAGELDIEVSSAGDLFLEVEADAIDIEVSSSGEATLSGSADRLDLEVSSAGDLDAAELIVAYCDAEVSSAGDAYVNVTEELNAEASSAGHIRYKGDPKRKNIDSSSAGSVSSR